MNYMKISVTDLNNPLAIEADIAVALLLFELGIEVTA